MGNLLEEQSTYSAISCILYYGPISNSTPIKLLRSSTNGISLDAIGQLRKAIYLKNKVPSSLYHAFYSMDLSEIPNL